MGTVFSMISLFDGPGMSLNRLVAKVVSKIERDLIVPALFRIVNAKLTVSSSVEKSSLVYKINLTVFVADATGGWGFSFLQEMMIQAAMKIANKVRDRLILIFLIGITVAGAKRLPADGHGKVIDAYGLPKLHTVTDSRLLCRQCTRPCNARAI